MTELRKKSPQRGRYFMRGATWTNAAATLDRDAPGSPRGHARTERTATITFPHQLRARPPKARAHASTFLSPRPRRKLPAPTKCPTRPNIPRAATLAPQFAPAALVRAPQSPRTPHQSPPFAHNPKPAMHAIQSLPCMLLLLPPRGTHASGDGLRGPVKNAMGPSLFYRNQAFGPPRGL